MIGKKFIITGMRIEIIADKGDKWQVRNLTTRETLFFDKAFFEKAMKLGKVEEVSESDDSNKD